MHREEQVITAKEAVQLDVNLIPKPDKPVAHDMCATPDYPVQHIEPEPEIQPNAKSI
jgi:hypothetical protein